MSITIRSGTTDGAVQFNGIDVVPFDANGIKGVVTQISTTGGTTTLTGAQASASAIEISGTLTSNAIIVIPNSSIIKSYENLTTGAFTVTIKTLAGTGVLVDQGGVVPAYSNGTNAESLAGLGYGQTWQAFTSVTRVFSTTYYNTTGKPIMVECYGIGVGDTTIGAIITGSTMSIGRNSVSGGAAYGSIIVPAGASYQITYSGSTWGGWSELR
jgi:hypothetical protein